MSDENAPVRTDEVGGVALAKKVTFPHYSLSRLQRFDLGADKRRV